MGCSLRSRQAEELSVSAGSCLQFLREIKPPCMHTCVGEVVCELPFPQQ